MAMMTFLFRRKKEEVSTTSKLSALDVPLKEMERTYEKQLAGIDSIKTTIRAIFSAASLIVTLAGSLQVFSLRPVAPVWLSWYQNGIVLIGVLYVALIVVCIAGMWPVYVTEPLIAEWDELTTAYQGLDDEEIKAKQLSSLLNAIDLNKPIVRRYFQLQIAALFLLPLLVVFLLSLALIPRA